MDFVEMVLDHIACSHAALDKAHEFMQKQASVEKQIEELIPEVVEALVKHERIDPSQREKAAALLRDPVQALKILIKAADVNQTIRPKSMGVPHRNGANRSTVSDYRDFHAREESEAYRIFKEKLLGGV
jgi:hypothetical protein